LNVGTPAKILKAVATHKGVPRDAILRSLERGETTLSNEVRY
jgi:hypothetical protein